MYIIRVTIFYEYLHECMNFSVHVRGSEQILRLGWDTMSSTSSGLLCKMAAASLNVTPSKLVLFKEMRRPPEKNQQIITKVVTCSQMLSLSLAM